MLSGLPTIREHSAMLAICATLALRLHMLRIHLVPFQAELDKTIAAHDALKENHGSLQAQMYDTQTKILPKLKGTEEQLR